VIEHEGKKYKVLKTHIARGDWKPDTTASLFIRSELNE
jgi:hypothetical protein